MKQTEHYKLPNWELDDPIRMDDFNAMTQTLDNSLHSLQNAVDESNSTLQVVQTSLENRQPAVNALPTENTIDDDDSFPFFDHSANAQRKSLWTNIKAKLKSYFDTIYHTKLTFDNAPTANSTNPVTSSGIKSALDAKAASSHTHALSTLGITATADELNKLAGCTATADELNHLDGVTSNIQAQLNGKLAADANAASATKLATARTIRTNLASTSTASFNGTDNVTPGVTGILPVANGGTGQNSLAKLAAQLGTAAGCLRMQIASYTVAAGENITKDNPVTVSASFPIRLFIGFFDDGSIMQEESGVYPPLIGFADLVSSDGFIKWPGRHQLEIKTSADKKTIYINTDNMQDTSKEVTHYFAFLG